MRLVPYPRQALRWEKVCKHVFSHGERWWQIYGDLPSWTQDWNGLRAAGVVDRHGPHPELLAQHDSARSTVERHHDQWLAAAERACDEAVRSGRTLRSGDDGTRCYVGRRGVTVYVVDGNKLRTCFRPVDGRRSRGDTAREVELACGRARRAAVRRSARRASLLSETTTPGHQEGSP